MPYGPKGEWRPAETGPAAIHVMKIATGEIQETYGPPEPKPKVRRDARKAAKARAAGQTSERRRAVAKAASAARWAKGAG